MPDSLINEQRPQTLERSTSDTFRTYLSDDQLKHQQRKENALVGEVERRSDQKRPTPVKIVDSKECAQVQSPGTGSLKRATANIQHSRISHKNKERESSSPLTVKEPTVSSKSSPRHKPVAIIPAKRQQPHILLSQCSRETVLTRSTSDQNIFTPKKPAHVTQSHFSKTFAKERHLVKSMEITPEAGQSVAVVEYSPVRSRRNVTHEHFKVGPDINVEYIHEENLGKFHSKVPYTRRKIDSNLAEDLAFACFPVVNVAPCSSGDKKTTTHVPAMDSDRKGSSAESKLHCNDRQFNFGGGLGCGGGGGDSRENPPLENSVVDGSETSGSCGQDIKKHKYAEVI
uniref:Uncharacterized protein n=1 Tax=Romanomermis culicivorax TaxID=13658 RepID=A0A915J147_ROMCU